MDLDFILNGTGVGDVAASLISNNLDYRALKPWVHTDGYTYINNVGPDGAIGALRTNSVGVLRKDEWVALDKAVMRAANLRLKAANDLISRGLTYNIPNAMGTTVFQSQSMSDLNDAEISMTGLEETTNEKLQFDVRSIPLPITHKDLKIPIRLLSASRNSGGGSLDTLEASIAGTKIAETTEKLLIGTEEWANFAGGSIYGYTTFPQRQTAEISDWEASVTTGDTMKGELIEMIQAANSQRCYGPFQVYITPNIALQLERDFKATGDKTIRTRLLELESISGIASLDFLPEKTVLLVPMDGQTVRLLMGMMPQTVQWETKGGMLIHLKAMSIMVPQIRSDFYGRCGIVHGSVASS